ncbi:aminotransferase class IV [Paradesertivirga mongoliensis]|uniref:branched-chain-amino-acid transaminase n=1 Tax=Paradesertivirga mongoliensis TaxID=2100740 RepID=A0ABW4ZLE1_9SPHI|nr:aminotransferase class IV [Pedobacter mongoliensis]
MNFINYNGEILPAAQPVLTIANRGFRYGDGLFESMRYMNGKLQYAELHAQRLQRGMATLKLEGFKKISADFLRKKVDELVRRNSCGQNARVRLTVFRDSDGLYSPTGNQFAYTLELSSSDESSYIHAAKGLIVDVYDEVTKPVNTLANLKTCNSLVYVMAGIYRKQKSLDEVFILNSNGFLCEAMSANVFVVFKKKIYTPALSEGCIAGVMRSVTMQLAKDNKMEVIEAQINPDILNEAEEVFLTNATRGIQWVMGFNNKRYFNEVAKDLQEKLNSSIA